MRRILALSLVLALAACAGGGRKPPAGSGEAAAPAAPTAAPAPASPGPAVSPAAPVPPAQTATITGTVTYRQRTALTPEAIVQIELRDVSREEAEAPLLARQILEKPGQVPIAFALSYDPGAIDPRGTYAVSARITDRGQLQFVTETSIPVLTHGAPSSVEILVAPVR